MYTYNNSVFDSTEFALTCVEVMMFRALLLVERVTATNNSSLDRRFSGPITGNIVSVPKNREPMMSRSVERLQASVPGSDKNAPKQITTPLAPMVPYSASVCI